MKEAKFPFDMIVASNDGSSEELDIMDWVGWPIARFDEEDLYFARLQWWADYCRVGFNPGRTRS